MDSKPPPSIEFCIDCHYIREKPQSEDVELFYINTSDQAVDFFTKAVGKKDLQGTLTKLGMVNINRHLEGEY